MLILKLNKFNLKSKKYLLIPILFVSFSIFFVSDSTYGQQTRNLFTDPVSEEVVQAASLGLDRFLKAIPKTEINFYGFSNEEEINLASLGEPFRVYTITPDRIFIYDGKMKLSDLISPTNLWFFPVYSFGTAKAILTVDLVDNQWKAVAFGRSELVKQLNILGKELPVSEGDDCKFVRIYQAKSDFVVYSSHGSTNMIPLRSAEIALQLGKTPERGYRLYEPLELIPKLKPIVRENLR